MKLLLSGLVKYICGLVLVGALVFWPAGTWAFWRGWLFMGLLFVPMLAVGFVMFFKDPQFLAKRLDAKEKQKEQKSVLGASAVMFIGGFLVAGLDRRFGWSNVPVWVTVVAAALFLLAYGLYGEVMRENAYLSRVIRVEQGQQVVDTGLYALVRHPMYMATLVLFLMMPLVLGSWYALMVFAAYPAIIIIRLKAEEELLTRELPGYLEYKQKVKYRLIPYIW